jgi:3-deoxy-D-manno-octulosonic-acid transferase
MKTELAKNAKGLNIIFRSDGEFPGGADVYVADTLGEMGIFYRSSDTAFMGRSLLPDNRGSSPIEGMKLGAVIATGPYTSTFEELYEELAEEGLLTRADNGLQISEWVMKMLSHGDDYKKLKDESAAFIEKRNSSVDCVIHMLKPLLD